MSPEDLATITEAQDALKAYAEANLATTTNTNLWHHEQTYDDFVDFSKELVEFKDDGNSSVDMRLSFHAISHTAYIALLTANDLGQGCSDILGAEQINISWEEGLRLLGMDKCTARPEML